MLGSGKAERSLDNYDPEKACRTPTQSQDHTPSSYYDRSTLVGGWCHAFWVRKRDEKGVSGLTQINCKQPRLQKREADLLLAVDKFVDSPLVFSGRSMWKVNDRLITNTILNSGLDSLRRTRDDGTFHPQGSGQILHVTWSDSEHTDHAFSLHEVHVMAGC
jgi:hypothetical protein